MRFRWIGAATVLLLFIAFAYHARGYYHLVIDHQEGTDIFKRWVEQQSILRGATGPDNPLTEDDLGFRPKRNPSWGGYPPWAFLLGNILFWPPWPAVRSWYALANVIATVVIVGWVCHEGRRQFGKHSVGIQVFLAAAVLAVNAFCRTLVTGQYGIICIAFLALSLWLAEGRTRSQSLLSGLMLGLAMTKPAIAIPFLVPFFVKRRWLVIHGAIAYLSVATLVVWIQSDMNPITMLQGMFGAAAASVRHGDMLTPKIDTLGINPYMSLNTLAFVALAALLVIAIRFRDYALLHLFSLAAFVSQVWTYHRRYDNVVMVFLVVALGISMIRTRKLTTVAAFVFLGLSLWHPGRIAVLPLVDVFQIVAWITALFVLCRDPTEAAKSRSSQNDTSLPCAPLPHERLEATT